MNYLSIDIGTTGCKCQLFSETGEILQYLFTEYDFLTLNGYQYVDIHAIEKHLRQMIATVSEKHEISSVCISSLGESFVLVDKDDNVLFYPMLYTDSRGEKEAEEIKATIGEENAFLTTGVIPHSMYSLSKLLVPVAVTQTSFNFSALPMDRSLISTLFNTITSASSCFSANLYP
jgi:xylulokinase